MGRNSTSPSGGKQSNGHDSGSTKTGMIILGVVASLLIFGGLLLYFLLRYFRMQYDTPKYIPGRWLKAKWRSWTPGSGRQPYSSALNNRNSMLSLPIARTASPSSAEGSSRASRILMLGPDGERARQSAEDNADVQRNTSLRSVQTLPAYSADLRPTETLVGREGERAGIDTVIDLPETAEEEEARREEEMDSLYQIRRARREERAQREEHRQRRREARARGDRQTLANLRLEELERASARSNTAAGSANALVREHESRERGRRVSSVDYAAVGLARHDGSRVRTSSNASERGLLDSAASFGAGGRERSSSGPRAPFAQSGHGRDRSNSSLRNADYSDEDSAFEFVPTPLETGSRRPSATRLRTEIRPDDETELEQSQPSPPEYETIALGPSPHIPEDDAPPYESPVRLEAPSINLSFGPLPSIEVTSDSPVDVAEGSGGGFESRPQS